MPVLIIIVILLALILLALLFPRLTRVLVAVGFLVLLGLGLIGYITGPSDPAPRENPGRN